MPQLRGFSFVEMMIAIFLVGILATLSGTVLSAPLLAKHSKYENTALSIASDKLESLRAGGYNSLPASGSFSTTTLSLIPHGAGAVAVTTYSTKTKQVVVTVSWREDTTSATSSVALTTLITSTGGLP